MSHYAYGSLSLFLGAITGCAHNPSVAAAPCKPAPAVAEMAAAPVAPKAEEWSTPEGKLVTVVIVPKVKAGHPSTYEEANMQENYFDIRSVDGQPIENLRIHVESSGDLPTSEATAQGYFYRAVAPYSVVPGFSDESQQGYGFRYDLNLRIKPVAKPEVPEAPTTKKRAGKKPR